MEECLQLLIKDLSYLQYRLDAEFCIDKFIHNKLINVCQDIPTCQYVCFKSEDSLAGFINYLRSSIITFQKSNPDNMQTQAFFTDRRYYKQHHPPLLSCAQRDRGNNRRDNKGRLLRKRCFVYNKKGC